MKTYTSAEKGTMVAEFEDGARGFLLYPCSTPLPESKWNGPSN
jgi:hypothetical protein